VPEDVPSWSIEDARAYLPRLRTLLEVIRRATEISSRASGNGHSGVVGDGAVREEQDEIGEHPSELSARTALEELSDQGVILRDPSQGLVDFPSRRPSGRVVLLCWRLGEEDLGWWHLPEDGFAGRRPLPVPPDV
jgi:hypothetical protein